MMTTRSLFLAIILLLCACGNQATRPSPSPEPTLSPELTMCSTASHPLYQKCETNGDVTQRTTDQTICQNGWAGEQRRASKFDYAAYKRYLLTPGHSDISDQWLELGLHKFPDGTYDRNPAHYELDHRLPIELGGAVVTEGEPDNRHGPYWNLSLEWWPDALVKDKAEDKFNKDVCVKHVPLVEAQQAFIGDWLEPWPEYRSP